MFKRGIGADLLSSAHMAFGGEVMQIFLGQAPAFFWWFVAPGLLILSVAWAVSIVVRSYARLAAVHGFIKVALATLETKKKDDALARSESAPSVLSRYARRPSVSQRLSSKSR